MRPTSRWPAAAFAAAVVSLLAFQPYLSHYIAEDSYITFRYVANALDSKGLVYNAGERVEGFSSPLYTLLLIVLGRAYKNVIFWARVVGLGATAITLVGCWRIVKSTSRSPATTFALIATLLIATPAFHIYATLGMETPFFMSLLTWGVTTSIESRGRLPGVVPALLFGLVGITRPEGPLYAALWFGSSCSLGPQHDESAATLRRTLGRVAICAAPFLLYEIFRLYYYQSAVPNVYYAKPIGFMHDDVHGAGDLYGIPYLVPWLVAATPPLFGIVMLSALARVSGRPFVGPDTRRLIAHSAGPVVAAIVFVLYTQGDWFMFGRYVLPVWPVVVVGLIVTLVDLASAGDAGAELRWTPRRLLAAMAVIIMACAGAWTRDIQTFVRNEKYAPLMKGRELTEAGKWFAQTFPRPLEAGMCTIGSIGFAARQHIIRDICGLVDRDQARWISRGSDAAFADTPVGRRHLDVLVLNLLNADAGLDGYSADYLDYLRKDFVCVKRFPQGRVESTDFWVRKDVAADTALDCDLSLE